MTHIKIKQGLDIPIAGHPVLEVGEGNSVSSLALRGGDYNGMKPALLVKVGDRVKLGQPLFKDKKCEAIIYTSPGAGVVRTIHRGQKRAFLSIVIDLDGDEEVIFEEYSRGDISRLKEKEIKDQLIRSGLWTALRSRPFDKVAHPEIRPHSLFVTAMDTAPLSPDINLIVKDKEKEFETGLEILSRLTEGLVHVCVGPGSDVTVEESEKIRYHVFSGPHPAGLVGTHIHFIDPVGRKKTVWHLSLQDLIAFGRLFLTGRLSTERIISLVGPGVKNPRMIRTRLGASILDLTRDELVGEKTYRFISGSVLSGTQASAPETGYLGRYDQQVAVVEEGHAREFLGMISPGGDKFSVKNVFLSKLFLGKKFNFTTSTQGGRRALVPIGSYEQVMPLDIIPTYLLRSLLARDTDQAVELGALELVEEDIALCTFVCPSKHDYGPILRDNLIQIEKEG